MKILEAMRTFITNKWLFLMVLNVFLLIVGCLMDIFSAIIVVVPLILPIAEQFGVNPLHLAIVFLTNLEIGYITPPVGINLFISSFRFNRPVLELYRVSIPYLILMIIALLIITYIPWLTLLWFS
jgi:TRAP-type C4-dicarboxylate transport system permease large subunit